MKLDKWGHKKILDPHYYHLNYKPTSTVKVVDRSKIFIFRKFLFFFQAKMFYEKILSNLCYDFHCRKHIWIMLYHYSQCELFFLLAPIFFHMHWSPIISFFQETLAPWYTIECGRSCCLVEKEVFGMPSCTPTSLPRLLHRPNLAMFCQITPVWLQICSYTRKMLYWVGELVLPTCH